MKEQHTLPTLLVVDDDLFIRRQVSHIAGHYFRVRCSSSTVAIAESILEDVDTLVLDLSIPGGDAVAFMQSLARRAPQIRLILVSGLDLKTIKFTASVARQLNFRSVELLEKPFTRKTLVPVLLRDIGLAADVPDLPVAGGTAAMDFEAELLRALQQSEFVSWFQPQVRLYDRGFLGAEALCRWRHPRLGLLGLGEFIERVETGPLAMAFTLYMADEAIGKFKRATEAAGLGGHLSINLPVAVLEDPKLASYLGSILQKHAFRPQDLIVEITERGIGADTAQSSATIANLRIRGIRISLDDFGTGYSSFEKIKDIAIDEIKIDKHFVSDAVHSRTSQTLINAALRIAEELDLQVVAEGINTEPVAAWLASRGNIIGQGYLYSHPLPEDALIAYLQMQVSSAEHADRRVSGFPEISDMKTAHDPFVTVKQVLPSLSKRWKA
jgi:EAL domain-containing protein (putative c-di-GMP-specific phosphodiesterase class I)/ActR/RegA family two-component response regulator